MQVSQKLSAAEDRGGVEARCPCGMVRLSSASGDGNSSVYPQARPPRDL